MQTLTQKKKVTRPARASQKALRTKILRKVFGQQDRHSNEVQFNQKPYLNESAKSQVMLFLDEELPKTGWTTNYQQWVKDAARKIEVRKKASNG